MELFWRLNVVKLLQEQRGKMAGGQGVGGSWGFRGEPGLSAGITRWEMLCAGQGLAFSKVFRCLEVQVAAPEELWC